MGDRFARMMTRAATSGTRASFKPALGNLKPNGARRGRGVAAGTLPITFVTTGQPMAMDEGLQQQALDSYLGHAWVMQCARVTSNTIAELPWVAGMDPTNPATYTPAAPLARFLGPATPQAPGGPNPVTAARAFWSWSIIQYLILGRFAWEAALTGRGKDAPIVSLWPLVAAALQPKATDHGDRYFNGFAYYPATGQKTLAADQVVYCWRPNISDWRQPESVLQAATMPVFVARGVDRYLTHLLRNDLVATTMVVTPPFAEADQRRAWQDQFMSEFTGVDRTGATIFAEVEDTTDTPSKQKPVIQVERIAQSVVDSQLLEAQKSAKQDICISFGVPESLIGNASTRCVPDDTEALTTRGWVNGRDLTTADTILSMDGQGRLVWSPVHEVFRNEHYSGPMYRLSHRHADFLVTPGHNWAVETADGLELRAVESLSTHDRIRAMGDAESSITEPSYSSAFVELVGWAVTEGHFVPNAWTATRHPTWTAPYVRLCQSESSGTEKVERIEACLKEVGAAYSTRTDKRRPEMHRWDVRGEVADAIHHVAPGRVLTLDFLLALTAEQRHLLLTTMLDADGSRQRGTATWTFCQKDKGAAEAFVVLATLCGYRTSMKERAPTRGFPQWQVLVGQRKHMTVQRGTRSVQHYEGMVWCPRTSYGTFVARRNGRVVVTGNTFANADAEYKNFWTITVLPLISELQDHINQALAPRVGTQVGWFDLARVAALKPPPIFEPPTITSVIATQVASPAQVANVLGIPPANATSDTDTTTVEIDQQTANPFAGTSGGMGGRWVVPESVRRQSFPLERMTGDARRTAERWMVEAAWRSGKRYEPWPEHVNTTTLKGIYERAEYDRKPISVRTIPHGVAATLPVVRTPQAIRAAWFYVPGRDDVQREVIEVRSEVVRAAITSGPGFELAERFRREALELRKVAVANRLGRKVHDYLADNYPEDTLDWVDDADWSGPKAVDLDDVEMDRRPGGRDQAKVQGIAKGIAEGSPGALAPVVLVKTPSGKLKVADGYHRTLAHRRVGHKTVQAYVGEVDSDTGPWDREMHDRKLNRAIEEALDQFWFTSRAGICTGDGPCDTSPIGTGKNWVTKTTPLKGLGPYARAVAHALIRSGHSKQEAIAIAIGVMRKWAAGKGTFHGTKVTPHTQAMAAKELKHWEELKAKDHARRADSDEQLAEVELIEVRAVGRPRAPHRPSDVQACHYCSAPATKSLIWGTGRAYVPVCPDHERAARRKVGEVDKVVGIERRSDECECEGPCTCEGSRDVGQDNAAYHLGIADHLRGKPCLDPGEFLDTHPTADADDYPLYVAGYNADRYDLSLTSRAAFVGEWSAQGPGPAQGSGTPTGASDLLPVGPTKRKSERITDELNQAATGHLFRGMDLDHCDQCGQPILAPVHQVKPVLNRHAGPGHEPVVSGHARGSLSHHLAKAKREHLADVQDIEDELHAHLLRYFGQQRQATINRLVGKRGKTMLKRAAEGPQGPDIPATDAGTTPPPSVAAGLNPSAIFDSTFWTQKLAQLLAEAFEHVLAKARGRVRREVGAPEDFEDRHSLQHVDDVLKQRAQQSAVAVTNTTKRAIFGALQQGIAEGTSMQGLSARVNQVFHTAAVNRARMIAQTEAVGSLNQAAHQYAAALPDGMVGSKTWLAHHDDRTRPAHRLADGQQVPVDQHYLVGGYRMMFPGTPSAPADLVINCRCGQAFLPPGLSTQVLGQAVKAFVPPTTQARINDVLAAHAAKASGYDVTGDLGG